jgi:predicted RNase H-like nuclease (RuvC/YqgF family)
MRTALVTIAAAASALAFAAPASAQWYPQPRGYAYGYQYNYGHVRSLQARINMLQRHIARLDSRDIITEREARRLRVESRDLERRLHRAARYGLHPREAYAMHNRIERLEYRIFRDARDGRRWSYYGYRR